MFGISLDFEDAIDKSQHNLSALLFVIRPTYVRSIMFPE